MRREFLIIVAAVLLLTACSSGIHATDVEDLMNSRQGIFLELFVSLMKTSDPSSRKNFRILTRSS